MSRTQALAQAIRQAVRDRVRPLYFEGRITDQPEPGLYLVKSGNRPHPFYARSVRTDLEVDDLVRGIYLYRDVNQAVILAPIGVQKDGPILSGTWHLYGANAQRSRYTACVLPAGLTNDDTDVTPDTAPGGLVLDDDGSLAVASTPNSFVYHPGATDPALDQAMPLSGYDVEGGHWYGCDDTWLYSYKISDPADPEWKVKITSCLSGDSTLIAGIGLSAQDVLVVQRDGKTPMLLVGYNKTLVAAFDSKDGSVIWASYSTQSPDTVPDGKGGTYQVADHWLNSSSGPVGVTANSRPGRARTSWRLIYEPVEGTVFLAYIGAAISKQDNLIIDPPTLPIRPKFVFPLINVGYTGTWNVNTLGAPIQWRVQDGWMSPPDYDPWVGAVSLGNDDKDRPLTFRTLRCATLTAQTGELKKDFAVIGYNFDEISTEWMLVGGIVVFQVRVLHPPTNPSDIKIYSDGKGPGSTTGSQQEGDYYATSAYFNRVISWGQYIAFPSAFPDITGPSDFVWMGTYTAGVLAAELLGITPTWPDVRRYYLWGWPMQYYTAWVTVSANGGDAKKWEEDNSRVIPCDVTNAVDGYGIPVDTDPHGWGVASLGIRLRQLCAARTWIIGARPYIPGTALNTSYVQPEQVYRPEYDDRLPTGHHWLEMQLVGHEKEALDLPAQLLVLDAAGKTLVHEEMPLEGDGTYYEVEAASIGLHPDTGEEAALVVRTRLRGGAPVKDYTTFVDEQVHTRARVYSEVCLVTRRGRVTSWQQLDFAFGGPGNELVLADGVAYYIGDDDIIRAII